MKSSILVVIPLLHAGTCLTNAAIAPGDHDQISWCPPNSCKFYTNPFGYVGTTPSSFWFCYRWWDPTRSTAVTNAIWTTSLTTNNVTATSAPPDGWIQPETCTAEQYSECTTDDDCNLSIHPTWCECYATSSSSPVVDICDAAIDYPFSANCTNLLGCEENTKCEHCKSFCMQGTTNGEGGGTCMLDDPNCNFMDIFVPFIPTPRETTAGASTGTGVEEVMWPSLPCSSNDDCVLKQRSRYPMYSTGVGICDCYASSTMVDDFDECEGGEEAGCRVAKCQGGMCEEWEAYCSFNLVENNGTCVLRTHENVGVASTNGAGIIKSPSFKSVARYFLYYFFTVGLISLSKSTMFD